MDGTMLRSFTDELTKISATISQGSQSSSSVKTTAIPAPPRTTFKNVTKDQTKAQNYSNVNMQAPMAALDTASGSKTVPPPPVQT